MGRILDRINGISNENIYEVIITTYTEKDWEYVLEKTQELEMNGYFDELSINGMTVLSDIV